MTDTTVKRVARALAKRRYAHVGGDSYDTLVSGKPNWTSCVDDARAAIEAIEQSDEVVARLIKEIAGYTGETVTKAEAMEMLRSSLKGEGE